MAFNLKKEKENVQFLMGSCLCCEEDNSYDYVAYDSGNTEYHAFDSPSPSLSEQVEDTCCLCFGKVKRSLDK